MATSDCHPDRAKTLVAQATSDQENPLSKLAGNGLVWSNVFQKVTASYIEEIVRETVRLTPDAYRIMPDVHWRYNSPLRFPESRDLNINMMPFKLYDPAKTLPGYCHQYIPMILRCTLPYAPSTAKDRDKIAYLTIHESDVSAGETQRRPGLHIERPSGPGGRVLKFNHDASHWDPENREYMSVAWGMGHWDDGWPVDGIFLASNVASSTRVWPALVDNSEELARNGCERLRPHLGEATLLDANQLCWITDRTPHESVAIDRDVHRQFFRLVVGPVGVWYSKHNTENPLGVRPDAPVTDVDKFA